MADNEPIPTELPLLPSKNWWDLRRRFQQAMPSGRVDAGYLQTVLNVGDGHARNLIRQLRQIGLIDENGRVTPLANDWRDDDTYAAACQQIVEHVYPPELTDALPPPNPDASATVRWFTRTLSVGQSAATKLAAFYRLVASGDVADQQAERTQREPSAAKRVAAAPKQKQVVGSDAGIGREVATVDKRGGAFAPHRCPGPHSAGCHRGTDRHHLRGDGEAPLQAVAACPGMTTRSRSRELSRRSRQLRVRSLRFRASHRRPSPIRSACSTRS